jgi:hypothetical protein
MQWIATPKKDDDNDALEKRLWDAADQFRANSGLTAQQYSQPVLGLIFCALRKSAFLPAEPRLKKRAPAVVAVARASMIPRLITPKAFSFSRRTLALIIF